MNIHVQVFGDFVFTFSRSRIVGFYGNHVYSFEKLAGKLFFQTFQKHYFIFPPTVSEGANFSTSLSTLDSVCLFLF